MAQLVHRFKRSYTLRMSPDGRRVAQTNSTQITIFDSVSYEQIAQFTGIPNAQVVFSDDSKYLAAKSTNGKLGLYDMDSLELTHRHTLKGNSQTQDQGIIFSPDGGRVIDLVYTNSLLGYIAVWDTSTWLQTRHFEGENNVFKDIVYSRERKQYFVSGFHRGVEQTARNTVFYLWFDADSGTGTFCDTALKNNERLVLADKAGVILSYSGVGERNAQISVLPQNETLLSQNGQIHGVALSNDNSLIAIMTTNHAAVYAFPSMAIVAELDTMNCFGPISFSPDGGKVLIGTWKDGLIYELD